MSNTKDAPLPSRTALVTGGNRGIGLEVCRQLARANVRVLLGSRDLAHGEREAKELRALHATSDVRAIALDVGSDDSVRAAAHTIEGMGLGVDALINNAGVLFEVGVLDATDAQWRESIEVNFVGALRCVRAFVPGMIGRGYGRVVNVSSGWGLYSEGLGPAPYGVTKLALGGLTRKLAEEVRAHRDVKVNAMCPGWVKTRMGGDGAPRSVEEGADTAVWLATLPSDGPSGGVFRDRKPLEW